MFRQNIAWVLAFFGTAVGAGILFLPLQASAAGILVLLLATVVSIPAVYYAHKNIGVVMAESKGELDYTGAVTEFLGIKVGFWANLLFFITLFLILIVYSSGLNNEFGEFMYSKHITKHDLSHSPFLSLGILIILLIIIRIGEKIMLRFMGLITFLLVFMLLAVSFYLIPSWNSSVFSTIFDLKDALSRFLEIFPIFILSFSFYPAMSSMVIAFKSEGMEKQAILKRSSRNVMVAMILLFVFIMFFVLSCVLSLSASDLKNAMDNNLSVLTVLALHSDGSILSIAGPLISQLALITSFIGTFLGARESARELLKDTRKVSLKNPKGVFKIMAFDDLLLIGFLASIWVITILHLPILDTLGEVVAPPVAFFLFILPIFITYRIKRLKKYRSFALIFSFAMGCLMLFSYVAGKMI
jgi:serine transporter